MLDLDAIEARIARFYRWLDEESMTVDPYNQRIVVACEAVLTNVPALVAECRRLREALDGIARRYEREDTGVGYPKRGGPLAWAMHDDARTALADGQAKEGARGERLGAPRPRRRRVRSRAQG